MKLIKSGKIWVILLCVSVITLTALPVWASGNVDIGHGAQAGNGTGNVGNVAIGQDAQAGNGENMTNNTAVGDNAKASGNESTAIGANSEAKHYNSVALGAGTVTERDNSVSVGNRQITNVLDGVADLDAVNVRQLNRLSSRLDHVGALAGAMSALAPLPYNPEERTQISVGSGLYEGQAAVALGVYHYTKPNALINGAFALSGSEKMGRVGATWSIKKSKKSNVEAQPVSATAAPAMNPAPVVAPSDEPPVISLNDIVILPENADKTAQPPKAAS